MYSLGGGRHVPNIKKILILEDFDFFDLFSVFLFKQSFVKA